MTSTPRWPSTTPTPWPTSRSRSCEAAGDPRWMEVPERRSSRLPKSRVVDGVNRLAAAHPSQRVALVCHGGVINVDVSAVLGVGPHDVLPAGLHEHQRGSWSRPRASGQWRRSTRRATCGSRTSLWSSCSCRPLGAGHVDPGAVLVDADVARQAEDPLAEDVRMISDVPPSIELARDRRNACCSAAPAAPSSPAAPSRSRRGTASRRRPCRSTAELVDVLVELGQASLPIEPSGPGVPTARCCAGPDVGEAQHLGLGSTAPSAGRGWRRRGARVRSA